MDLIRFQTDCKGYHYTFGDTPAESKTFNAITKRSVSTKICSENYKLARLLFVKIKKLIISFLESNVVHNHIKCFCMTKS